MHADAEYLSNVLSALSVQGPPGLGTLLALVAVPSVRVPPASRLVAVLMSATAMAGCQNATGKRLPPCPLPRNLSAQEEFFTTVQVAGRSGDGRLDPPVVDAVSRMRGISGGAAQQQQKGGTHLK
jgi:hypothetical protein